MCVGSCKLWYFGADVAPHTVYTVKPQTLAEPENKQFRVRGTAAICFSVTSERRGFFSFSWLDRNSYGEWKWTKRGESEQHELPEEFRGRAGANRQPADGQEALGARSTHAYRRSPNAERQTGRC